MSVLRFTQSQSEATSYRVPDLLLPDSLCSRPKPHKHTEFYFICASTWKEDPGLQMRKVGLREVKGHPQSPETKPPSLLCMLEEIAQRNREGKLGTFPALVEQEMGRVLWIGV